MDTFWPSKKQPMPIDVGAGGALPGGTPVGVKDMDPQPFEGEHYEPEKGDLGMDTLPSGSPGQQIPFRNLRQK